MCLNCWKISNAKYYLYLAETILTSRVYRNHKNWILSFVFIAVKGFWEQDTSTPETYRLLDGVKKTRGWGPTVILGSTPFERRPPRTRTHGASSRVTILPIRWRCSFTSWSSRMLRYVTTHSILCTVICKMIVHNWIEIVTTPDQLAAWAVRP